MRDALVHLGEQAALEALPVIQEQLEKIINLKQ